MWVYNNNDNNNNNNNSNEGLIWVTFVDHLNAIFWLHDYTRLLCLVEVFIFQIKKKLKQANKKKKKKMEKNKK